VLVLVYGGSLALTQALVVALYTPLRHRLQEGTDRRVFRGKVDLARGIAAYAREARTMLDLSDLLPKLLDRLEALLHLVHGAIYLWQAEALHASEVQGTLPQEAETLALASYIRERTLRQEARALRTEVDEAKRAKQVAEVTETDYFKVCASVRAICAGGARGGRRWTGTRYVSTP